MTELPYPYTITRGHEPTPPLQTAIEKINVYSSQYAHLSPRECAALRAELKRLRQTVDNLLTERVKILEMQISAEWGDE